MRSKVVLICVSAICASMSLPAYAVPLTGGVVDFYQSFTGSLAPVTVDLGSGPVSTGLISYTLDVTNPSVQQFAFNFSTLTATAQLDLRVNFPLLQTLGASPLTIHIAESGPIVSGVPDLPVGNNQSVTFRALLTGGGTVGPGSPFSGFTFSNINDTTVVKNVNVEAGGTFNETVNGGGNITLTATITQPGRPGAPTTGTGTFGIGPKPLPESSSLLLLISGLAGLAGYEWRRSMHGKRFK
jgi:hypothetical protein